MIDVKLSLRNTSFKIDVKTFSLYILHYVNLSLNFQN